VDDGGAPRPTSDIWAEWIRARRFAGDDENTRRLLGELAKARDKVLDRAELAVGETLLDVGCGDGLIAFGALERGAAEVIFSDISEPLLADSRALAEQAGVLDRCRFGVAAAEDLSLIEDASVDVVTTRSVLIYVKDKRRAFEEFFRVLRPGGRISLFEPINRFGCDDRRHTTFWGYDAGDLADLAKKVNAVFEAIQPPGEDPMLDFDERDLIDLAQGAGFFPIHLELEADVEPSRAQPWRTFANTAGNPKIPTFAEALEQALTPEERARVEAHLRPLVEAGKGTWKLATAYLAARKGEETLSGP
jgi:arsenite methyltransferase